MGLANPTRSGSEIVEQRVGVEKLLALVPDWPWGLGE
jgi:hypothetical protein